MLTSTLVLTYWFGVLQALPAQMAQALPVIILLTLLAGRRGNARLCLWGARRLLSLNLVCALIALVLFPLVALLGSLQEGQWPGLAAFCARPACVALLAWLPACLLLLALRRAASHWPDSAGPVESYRAGELRCTLWGCLLAFALLVLGSLLSTGLLLEPPQGMDRSAFLMLQIRQGLHLVFRYFSLAGGAALLCLWTLRHHPRLAAGADFDKAVRWCAVWAVAGYFPSIIDHWSTLLAALLQAWRAGVPIDLTPQATALAMSVLAALALVGWSVFLYRPALARRLSLQLLPWLFILLRLGVPLLGTALTMPRP